MSELMFVLKAFAMAAIITVFMQVKVGTQTLESQAEDFLQRSTVATYLQGVASGAALMIKNASKTTTDFISKKMGHDTNTEKASRLNLDIKRSHESESSNSTTRH